MRRFPLVRFICGLPSAPLLNLQLHSSEADFPRGPPRYHDELESMAGTRLRKSGAVRLGWLAANAARFAGHRCNP